MNIARTVSSESSGFHGSGDVREHQIFEWGCRQRLDPGVHAGRVGVENRPPLRIRAGVGLAGDMAEAMHAVLRVHLEGARADQRTQLAGWLAALQVHLEEAILRVQEPEGASGILSRGAGDRRTPSASRAIVTGAERPGSAIVAFELWQAGPQLRAHVAAACDGGDGTMTAASVSRMRPTRRMA